jgi:hypothetical protein
LGLFKEIFREIEVFSKILKTFSMELKGFLKWYEAFSNNSRLFKIISGWLVVFFINVGHFERFRGFLNTFSKKGRLLFRNLRLLKDISRKIEACA